MSFFERPAALERRSSCERSYHGLVRYAMAADLKLGTIAVPFGKRSTTSDTMEFTNHPDFVGHVWPHLLGSNFCPP